MSHQGPEFNIEAEDLSKDFGEVSAVKRLNLRIAPGEFFGFIGPNGAGKTTTISMLAGLLSPTSGRVRIAGYEVEREPLAVKAQVGLLQDEPSLYGDLSGLEFVEFCGRMHGLSREEARARGQQLLGLLAMEEEATKLIESYSSGMRKKVGLAAALIHGPRVLLLDEPFNGIDPVTARVVKDLLRSLTANGVTVFFSSHVLEVAEKLCTRVGIIHQGRLLACDAPEALKESLGLEAGATLEDVFLKMVGAGPPLSHLPWLLGRESG